MRALVALAVLKALGVDRALAVAVPPPEEGSLFLIGEADFLIVNATDTLEIS